MELLDPEIRPKAPKPRHSWLDWLVPSAWADETPETYEIHLKWTEVDDVDHYKIQIGRESSFKHVLEEAETEQPEWTWNYRVGMENSKWRIFYRVASVSEDGQVGEYSAPKAVQIPETILGSARAANTPKVA